MFTGWSSSISKGVGCSNAWLIVCPKPAKNRVCHKHGRGWIPCRQKTFDQIRLLSEMKSNVVIRLASNQQRTRVRTFCLFTISRATSHTQHPVLCLEQWKIVKYAYVRQGGAPWSTRISPAENCTEAGRGPYSLDVLGARYTAKPEKQSRTVGEERERSVGRQVYSILSIF